MPVPSRRGEASEADSGNAGPNRRGEAPRSKRSRRPPQDGLESTTGRYFKGLSNKGSLLIPYQIQCTTCRRTLTVRKESAIGQIVPCPKCGSMVLIEAPAGHQPPATVAGAPKATAADPKVRSRILDDTDLDAVLAAPDPQAADTVPDEGAEGAAETSRPRPPEIVKFVPVPPAPPNEDWASRETKLLKKWMFIGASAIAASILVIILGGLWLSSQRNDTARARGKERKTTVNKKDKGAASESQESDATANSSDEAASEPPETEEATPQAETEVETDPRDEATDPPDNEGPAEPMPEEPATDSADADANPSPSAEATGKSSGEPDPGKTATREGDADAREGSALTIPDALRELEGFLEDTTFDRVAPPAVSAFDMIPVPSTKHDLSAAMPRPARRDVNVDNQLKTRIPSVEFDKRPLSHFLRFVSDFASVPITIEPHALQTVGVEATAPISVTAKNEELGEILRSAIEPLGLQHQVVGRQIVVIAQSSSAEGFDEREYEVFDIVGDDAREALGLVDVVTTLIAPLSWKERGGTATISLAGGRLKVANAPEVQFEIMMLCERIRIARGQRPQGEVPAYFVDLTPRVALALPKLAQPITANYLAPARLTEILEYLGGTSGLQIIVDWRSLDELGHTPDSLAKIDVNEQPLGKVLELLLGPMELSFRVIDERTLQVTSAKTAFQKPDVELFRIADAAAEDGGQKVMDGVRSILGDGFAGQPASAGLRFDSRSSTLLVAAPQHQIAAIARLIEQLTSTPEVAPADTEAPMEQAAPEERVAAP